MTARDINDNRNDTNDETRENKRTRNTFPISRPSSQRSHLAGDEWIAANISPTSRARPRAAFPRNSCATSSKLPRKSSRKTFFAASRKASKELTGQSDGLRKNSLGNLISICHSCRPKRHFAIFTQSFMLLTNIRI